MLQNSTPSLKVQDFAAHARENGVARRGQSQRRARQGLSSAHIAPRGGRPSLVSASATFYDGGTLVEVRKSRLKLPQRGGGRRGCVTGYSRASRRRMMRMLAKVDMAHIPHMVTLTYPSEYPSNAREWKAHLDAFDKRLARRFPASAFVWKLEAQKRGAPHFHLLVWGVGYDELRAWVAAAWFEVVKSGDDKHLRAGVRVERIRTWRGVMSYAAKYLGKVEDLPDEWESPGRLWGLRRPANIPWAKVLTLSPTDKQAQRLMRYLRRYAHLTWPSAATAMTVFVGNGAFWAARSDDLLGAPF